VGTELKTILLPRLEVSTDIDGATNTLLLADTPELREGRCAENGRLVVAHRLQDVVGAAVNADATLLLSSAGWVVRAIGLDDVIFDEGVGGPAVERDVRILVGSVPGSAVGNGAGCSGLPSLTSNKVAYIAPGDGVLATLLYSPCQCDAECNE